jgi:hypothetical protein
MRHIPASLLFVCVSLANGSAAAPPAAAVPVLVELFTAEGCSSCPPADTLLEKMIEAQPASGAEIIGLGEHVDYWDRLGWKDRFSSAALTARQQKYAARPKGGDVYTPQMVVDGQEAFVGSDLSAARRAIERAVAAPHGVARITCEVSPANILNVTVAVSNLPSSERTSSSGDRADIIVAVTEDHLSTEVKRGENQGRTLSHAAVVRELRTVGEALGPSPAADIKIKMAPEWKAAHLKVVAFVQERGSRRVLATSAMAVPQRQ